MANQWQGQKFKYITTGATNVVLSGTGFLHTITLGQPAAGLITVYDNTAASGTKIAEIASGTVAQTFILDCQFGIGLTVVNAASEKLTVTYG